MRLEFTILWFENQLRELESQINELTAHIEESGFVPKFVFHPDATEVDELSRRQENFHEFDLVVVDWDLDGEQKGDAVAQRIRKHFRFTPIVFYSGTRPTELRDMVRDKAIDGVYCVHRSSVIQGLEDLTDDIVVGLSRLDAMRGLAVSTVSRCDKELGRVASHLYASAGAKEQERILKELDELVEGTSIRGSQKYKECKAFEARLATSSVTSFHLWKLALFLTKGNEMVADQRKVLCRYSDEVIQIRNTLGHATEVRTETSWKISQLDGKEMSKDDFPHLRRNFAAHLDNILGLGRTLGSDQAQEVNEHLA